MSKEYYERRAKEIVESKKPIDGAKPVESQASQSLAKVIQMPLWPEPKRAAPNVMLRSALFSVVEKGKRKALEKQTVASWSGTEIKFTGKQLDQFDETVWLHAVHLAAQQTANKCVATFKLTGFLRSLGLSKSKPALERLDAAFTRMIACEVDIEGEGFLYRDNMLGLHLDKATGVYTMRLNPKLAQLFESGFTHIEWQTRLALKTDLAKWLHSFVLTHRAAEGHPQRVALAKLKELCGVAQERHHRFFRRDLRRAMAQLEELGVVKTWLITDNDALEFTRKRQKALPEGNQ